MKKELTRVLSVIPLDNWRLQVALSNGKEGVYDISHLVHRGVFRKLQDRDYFSQVRPIENGIGIGWPGGTNAPDLSSWAVEDGLRALPKKSAVVRRAPRATARRPAATPVAPAKRAG